MISFSSRSFFVSSRQIAVSIMLFFVSSSLFAQLPTGRLITSAAIAINPETQKVYAVNEGAKSISVEDVNTGAKVIVPVGESPIALAVNRRTNRIYVVNTEGASISVIDGKTDKVIATVPVDKTPYTLAVNEVTNKIYVTHTYSDALTVIDGTSNLPSTIKTGSADGVAIDTQTNKIFLMGYESPKIRIVDGDTDTIKNVTVGPRSWGMLFDDASATLYLAHTGTGEIVVLNEKTLAVNRIPVGKIPCAVAINPKTKLLYVVNYGDETLSVIDLNRRREIATLPVGKHPQHVAVDVTRNHVFVADVHGDDVTVIDGSSNAVIGKVEAGTYPYAIAIDPRSGKVFAANYGIPWITAVASDKSVDEYNVPDEVGTCIEKLSGLTIDDEMNPFYLSGDFNGDSKLDFAVQVTRSGSKGVVICLSDRKEPLVVGAGSSLVFPSSEKWRFDAWSIIPKESKSVSRPAKAKYDAILLDVKETANGLLYWDGSQLRWEQLGD